MIQKSFTAASQPLLDTAVNAFIGNHTDGGITITRNVLFYQAANVGGTFYVSLIYDETRS